MKRHPILAFAILAIAPTWALQFFFLAQGWDLMPAKLAELVILLAAAVTVTAARDGRPGVRGLFATSFRWRFSVFWWAVGLFALPALTIGIAAAGGSLRSPADGWMRETATYFFLTVIFGMLLANLWEETAWAGFAQSRLMREHGLLRGSLLTAIPFALIHLPLAFEERGLTGTTGRDLAITWSVLILSAPVFRYLFGVAMLSTGGSVLVVALLHASFNASSQLTAVHGFWPPLVALAVLTAVAAVGYHARWGAVARQARLDERGYASAGSVSTLTR
ncbi:MAG: CPBP family intramembrane glutamic endopeptidase [Actinoplanes sp.]